MNQNLIRQKKYVNKHPLIHVYTGMKQRCYNANSKFYSHYGARGITVCERWLGVDGYKNFIADMGERPAGLSIDRINNDGNYEPNNCRWANTSTQMANRGMLSTNKTGVIGIYFYKWSKKNQWKAEISVNSKKIHLGTFRTRDDALAARLEAEIKYREPLLKGTI